METTWPVASTGQAPPITTISTPTGNTAGLSGQTGAYVDSYSYLPFGEETGSTGSVPNPFQYVGQAGVMTAGNGLDFMRARFYSPSTGRFIQRDPTGLAGGANLYAYTANDPVNLVDPTGLLRASDSAATTTVMRHKEEAIA